MESTSQTYRGFLGRTLVLKTFSTQPKLYALSDEILSSTTKRAIVFIFDLALLACFTFGYLLLLTPEKPLTSMMLVVFLPVVLLLFLVIPEWLFEITPAKWIFGLAICDREGAAHSLTGALI